MQPNLEKLFQDALVWDAHAGVFPSPEVDLNLLQEWLDCGVNYLSINVGFDVMDWQETLATLAAYRHWVQANTDRFMLINDATDIERARKEKKFALSFDIEGMNALNENINMVGVYHALGVRQMLFAYNLNNAAAGGCQGMIVDCSHAAYSTTMDIMHESSKPVVFSHSNPAAIWDHQRNITDEQIKACAATGGVIGVNGMGIFLGDNDISNATLMHHIEYLADLVGCQHIGFGFDYSPKVDVDIGVILRSRPDYWPAGQQYDTPAIKHAGPQQLQELVENLSSAGFGEDDIRGILGDNFRRVAVNAWQGFSG
jgi:membrane dipeptidase